MERRATSRLWRAVPWLLLVLAPVLASWPAFTGFSLDPLALTGGLTLSAEPGWFPGVWTLDLNVGVTTQALGHLAAEQWLRGEVPWWNAFTGIGMPLAGEMQASALFLPFVLLLHFANGPLLLKLAMQMLAGLASFALLRRLGLDRLAALLGGLMFGLCGTFAWLGHGPIMPVAFLPLFLLGIEYARTEYTRTGGWRLIALAVALSLTAGFPETAYIDGLFALVWTIWRLVDAPDRWRFAARVAVGGMLGLAIAAPALWSFAHMLLHGTAENHAVTAALFDTLPEPTPSTVLASWLFPAIYGPILGFDDQAGAIGATVGYLGGFLGALSVLLALIGLCGRSRRALRWILFGWVAFWIAGILQVPVISHLLYAVPMLRQTIVARYAIASWSLAVIGLAALAIDDWRRGERPRWALAAGPLAWLVVVLGALACGRALIVALAKASGDYWIWPVASLVWAALSAAIALWLLAGRPTPRRRGTLAVLLAVDAMAFFALPMLSAPRHPVVDHAAVAYLRENTGLQRFYALGPYRPNYGAFFDTPQLNHEYLPLPANWADHVRTALDPSANAIMFRGDEPPLPPGQPSHAAQMLRHLNAFAALGVRYIVTPAGQNPFATSFATAASPAHASAHALPPGVELAGQVDGAIVPAGAVDGIGVAIGTYQGAANGHLSAELCSAETCAYGTLDLATAADNATAMVPLSPVLTLRQNETLRWRLWHEGGSAAVAIWMPPGETTPRLEFSQRTERPAPPRVYRDPLLDIYRLPDAAPYFESIDGACRLTVQDRTHIEADCDAPARLVRRELYFSGWRAWVGDAPAEIVPYGTVMQSIALPAGHSAIRFAYAPPYAGLCWAVMALGLIGLLPFSRRR